MKIIEHLKGLDRLILENTVPPATSKLRNYLSVIIEQAETEGPLQDAMAKKEAEHAQTMAALHERTSKEIAALQSENAILKKRLAADSSWDDLEKDEANYQAILQSKMLKRNI